MRKTTFIFLQLFLCNLNNHADAKKHTNLLYTKIGIASYYGNPRDNHYNKMANGERFNPNNPKIAAHYNLTFGTKLRILNLQNKKTVCVRVTDRMPKSNRIIDLSYAAAKTINILHSGVAKVRITIISNREFYSKKCSSYDFSKTKHIA
jgi:rare lipoprotein A